MVAECRSRSTSLVDRRVLLDVGVGLRDVRLGLVVVVVRDEVLDRVVAATARGTRWPAARPASCSAPITRVGRCSRSINQAVVADLPVPVAPSSTLSLAPDPMRSVNASMAAGWSPDAGRIRERPRTFRSVRGLDETASGLVLMPPPYGPAPTPRVWLRQPAAASPGRAVRRSQRPCRGTAAVAYWSGRRRTEMTPMMPMIGLDEPTAHDLRSAIFPARDPVLLR